MPIQLPPPLVSVVIANYNRWRLLRESIESVLAQSFTDFELIVVDDGSTDGSADLVAAQFPSVRLLRQANAERGAAYNHGIREARGRYIAFLDNDDLYEPWHLSDFARVRAQAPEARVFACTASLWDPVTDRRLPLASFDPVTLPRDSLVGTVVPYQAMIVERSALLEIGGLPEDRDLMGCDDWLLLMNLAERWRVQPLPTTSVLIRVHSGRSMNDLEAIARSRQEATRRILDGELLAFELDEDDRRLLVAGTHRLTAAHQYGAGKMRDARASLRAVRRTVGLRTALPWTARLWMLTWLGPAGSVIARRARDRLVWR